MSSLWLRTPLLHAGGCFERSSGGPQYRVADGIRHLRHAAQPAPERWRVSVDRLDCRDRRKPDPLHRKARRCLSHEEGGGNTCKAKAGVLVTKAVESQGKGRRLSREGGGITGERLDPVSPSSSTGQRQVSWPRRRWNHRTKAEPNASTPAHPRAAPAAGEPTPVDLRRHPPPAVNRRRRLRASAEPPCKAALDQILLPLLSLCSPPVCCLLPAP